MAKIGEILEVAIAELKPYENNAKLHDADQVEKIADSIRAFGFISPCLIDKDKNIIAGHGRIAAAKEIGMDKVPCVEIEGLTEAQRRAYILADNRLTELGGWNFEAVHLELEALNDMGFDVGLTGFDLNPVEDAFIEDADVVEGNNTKGRVVECPACEFKFTIR